MGNDNPTEYISRLRTELLNERAARARVEQDRDEYRDQVHTLTIRLQRMTGAMANGASTAVAALDRLIELEPLVNAAEGYCDAGSLGGYERDVLLAEVKRHLARKAARS